MLEKFLAENENRLSKYSMIKRYIRKSLIFSLLKRVFYMDEISGKTEESIEIMETSTSKTSLNSNGTSIVKTTEHNHYYKKVYLAHHKRNPNGESGLRTYLLLIPIIFDFLLKWL